MRSVADFVERHYGREMVDRLADPLLSGVYGGESANLSVRAVLPRFAEMERTHGSLGRAMLAARKKTSKGPKMPAPSLFTSLKQGMQHLAEAVVAAHPILSFDQRARAGNSAGRLGWVVSAGMQSDHFDSVILALPGPAAANALRMVSNELATELGAAEYSSSITVGLGYDAPCATRYHPASDSWYREAKASNYWQRLSFTTNSRTGRRKIGRYFVASLQE